MRSTRSATRRCRHAAECWRSWPASWSSSRHRSRAHPAPAAGIRTPSAAVGYPHGRGRPAVGLPALPGLEPGRHGPAQPDGRRSRRVARQEPGRDDVGVRRRHRRAARLPRQARLPAGLDRPDLRRRREGAGRDGADGAHGARARSEPAKTGTRRRHEATVRGDRDDQGHARRLLPEPVRHVAVGRGEVERGPGERRGAAGTPRLPDYRQQPVRHLRRLDDRRVLGQPGRRRVRAEHGRLPGAQRRVLHRRRGDLA